MFIFDVFHLYKELLTVRQCSCQICVLEPDRIYFSTVLGFSVMLSGKRGQRAQLQCHMWQIFWFELNVWGGGHVFSIAVLAILFVIFEAIFWFLGLHCQRTKERRHQTVNLSSEWLIFFLLILHSPSIQVLSSVFTQLCFRSVHIFRFLFRKVGKFTE